MSHEPGFPACLTTRSDGWICTRGEGHEGDHAAHGLSDHPLAIWPRSIPLAAAASATASSDPPPVEPSLPSAPGGGEPAPT